jgi:predicted transcriptional regulator with HTH domain
MINLMAAILITFVACNAQSTPKQTTVKADEIAKILALGKSVQIKNATIEGNLDFGKTGNNFPVNSTASETQVNGNAYFEKCVFKGNVKAENVRFNGNVIFLQSEFQKEVEFQNSQVFGIVNFSKSVFKGKAVFSNMAVWAKNSYFSEVKASGKFSLEASDFHGDLNIMNSEYAGTFSLQETFVQGNLQAADSKFNGSTDFSMLNVLKRAIFTYATFKNEPNFSSSKIARE